MPTPPVQGTQFQRSQSPAGIFVAVTPGSTNFSGGPCRGLYVGVSGSVTITDLNGNSITFTGLAAGVIHPIQAAAVTAATASGIVAAY